MNSTIEHNKEREIATAEERKDSPTAQSKPFGPEWGSAYWGKWQTARFALLALGVRGGASVLDVGMGAGWTTVFLAESGYLPTGVDIAPAHIELAQQRAARVGVDADFIAADMDTLDLGRTFDAALVFDALHHTTRQSTVIKRIADHLVPGGWVLFGEPSWLHGLSPHARRTSRDLGWVERGIRVRTLKRDCSANGLGNFRRFFEGTSPYESLSGFGVQLGRLVAARCSSAPQMSVWIAAQKL